MSLKDGSNLGPLYRALNPDLRVHHFPDEALNYTEGASTPDLNIVSWAWSSNKGAMEVADDE